MALEEHLEFGRQLRQPTGAAGIETGRMMNNSNRVMYEDMFSLLSPAPGQTLLEIGFGNGLFFKNYFEKEQNLAVTGIDFSETMLEEASKNNRELIKENKLKLLLADASVLDFPADSFDFVITINTLYFWPSAAAQLQEIKRVLKPGGSFLLGYRPKEAVKDAPFTKEVFTLYNPAEVTALLQEAGFIIEQESENELQITDSAGKPLRMPGITIKAAKPEN